MGLKVGVLLSCMAIGAIGLSANWFESHLTARQVMLRLQEAGLPCTKVTTPGAVLPVRAYDWGTCQIEGERIGIVTYPTERDRKQADGLTEHLDPEVVGDHWRIYTDTAVGARRVQAAIGGEIRIPSCGEDGC